MCARDYRPGPIAQLHALAHAYAGPHEVATIYLRLFSPGSLADADLPRTHEMFRKRLDRAGFTGAIVVGGIEVAWQENWQRWLLHAQVLAIGVDPNAWAQLEAALEKSGTADPVRVVPLRNPGEQLSLQRAYFVATQFRQLRGDFERFQAHSFWKQSGTKPRDPSTSKWVLLFTMQATTTSVRRRAGKYATILDGLMQDQVESNAVASRIKELGGIDAAYEAMQTQASTGTLRQKPPSPPAAQRGLELRKRLRATTRNE